MSPKPAKDNGNRKDPVLAGKLKMPTDFKTTYGAGNGKGGPGVQAKDNGNRKNPSLAGKLKMPTSHDAYQGGPDNK